MDQDTMSFIQPLVWPLARSPVCPGMEKPQARDTAGAGTVPASAARVTSHGGGQSCI